MTGIHYDMVEIVYGGPDFKKEMGCGFKINHTHTF